MKKRYIFAVFLMVIILASVNAGQTDTTPTYVATSDFVIKAYKSSPDQSENPILMSVYDALTDNLDELGGLDLSGAPIAGDTHRIKDLDIYPYLDRFMEPFPSDAGVTDRNHVLFSYMITGSKLGSYTVTVKIDPFKNEKDSNSSIIPVYRLTNDSVMFPNDHSVTNAKGITITSSNSTSKNTNGTQIFTKTWKVGQKGDKQKDCTTWLSEGVISMYIDSKKYKDLKFGNYKSFVTVGLVQN